MSRSDRGRRDMVRVENAASKIYVGNLGDYGDKAELERAFSKYGEVVSVWERVTITFF
jgi:RNA recognition motif-containing protein